MVVSCAGENRQMAEELVTLKTKLKDLDQIFLDLHLQYSAMSNQQQPESSAGTAFSASRKFCGLKIEFPRFNGDDPSGWIHREEQYFNMHNTFDVTKVPLASFHLECEALQWFCWYINDHEELQWTYFANSFCTALALVVLMNSKEHSPNFTRLAL